MKNPVLYKLYSVNTFFLGKRGGCGFFGAENEGGRNAYPQKKPGRGFLHRAPAKGTKYYALTGIRATVKLYAGRESFPSKEASVTCGVTVSGAVMQL